MDPRRLLGAMAAVSAGITVRPSPILRRRAGLGPNLSPSIFLTEISQRRVRIDGKRHDIGEKLILPSPLLPVSGLRALPRGCRPLAVEFSAEIMSTWRKYRKQRRRLLRPTQSQPRSLQRLKTRTS